MLASTSPQRRAILAQLRIPFELAEPSYEEHDRPDADPVELVREHARGKARSVEAAGRLVLGVDTTVVLEGCMLAKPVDETDAAQMLTALAGKTHEVVSGLCLRGPDWEDVGHDTTRVTFRPLAEHEIAAYLSVGEWHGRAGGYAIQGAGAALVERIEGDYLNVVGLPGALLVRLLAARCPGTYHFG